MSVVGPFNGQAHTLKGAVLRLCASRTGRVSGSGGGRITGPARTRVGLTRVSLGQAVTVPPTRQRWPWRPLVARDVYTRALSLGRLIVGGTRLLCACLLICCGICLPFRSPRWAFNAHNDLKKSVRKDYLAPASFRAFGGGF